MLIINKNAYYQHFVVGIIFLLMDSNLVLLTQILVRRE